MNKKIYILFSIALLLFSCKQKSELNSDFNCSSDNFSPLETISDMKNLFSVKFPKNWKTNLYFDENQSSIFGADTTKQLTQSALLDISFIQKSVSFNDDFKLNLEREKLSEKLIRIKSVHQKFKHKNAYYSLSIGKKANYAYQVLDYFIQVNTENILHAKVQIYGDSLVPKRLCSALQLIEKIQIN